MGILNAVKAIKDAKVDHVAYKTCSRCKLEQSLENYGQWHVDHIIPCDSFDLFDVEQQKICFHYTNLQPLWAKDNLIKGNKYENNIKQK